MVRHQYSLLVLISMLLALGCTGLSIITKMPESASTSLDNAEFIELLSLDPDQQMSDSIQNFHGWKVLGRLQIKDAATRKKLVDALKKGAEENNNSVAMCFNPRHAMRTTCKGKTLDFVICFECLQVYVYDANNNDKRKDSFLTSDSPQPVFDQVLRDANIPLPQPSKK